MIKDNRECSLWNDLLKRDAFCDLEPESEVLRFLQMGKALLGRRGLDVGCGTGRHLLLAAKLGFDVTGIDSSQTAVTASSSLLRRVGMAANLCRASMTDLPFSSGGFDFSLSYCALNHSDRSGFYRAISEQFRVVKPLGHVFGFVLTKADPRYGRGIRVSEDCYICDEGLESGVAHYFPGEETLYRSLSMYGDIIIWDRKRHLGSSISNIHPGIPFSEHLEFVVRSRPLRFSGKREPSGITRRW